MIFNYEGPPNPNSFFEDFKMKLCKSSASWGVGPRAGFASNWLMGYGFRLIGNASADILYTRYSIHDNTQQAILASGLVTTNISVSQEIDYLRTHLDFELGFGWGSYFSRNECHIDLSATYGFQEFRGQNMNRKFTGGIDVGSGAPGSGSNQGTSFNPNGDLYVHGVTATARFDF
jgi:hypothetical protein